MRHRTELFTIRWVASSEFSDAMIQTSACRDRGRPDPAARYRAPAASRPTVVAAAAVVGCEEGLPDALHLDLFKVAG